MGRSVDRHNIWPPASICVAWNVGALETVCLFCIEHGASVVWASQDSAESTQCPGRSQDVSKCAMAHSSSDGNPAAQRSEQHSSGCNSGVVSVVI